MRKIPRFLARNGNLCNFGSLKNSDSVLKFTSSEIPTVHAINFSISCRELLSAIFSQNLVAMATSLTPMKFIYRIRIRRPRKPFNYVIHSSIYCTELKLVELWLIRRISVNSSAFYWFD